MQIIYLPQVKWKPIQAQSTSRRGYSIIYVRYRSSSKSTVYCRNIKSTWRRRPRFSSIEYSIYIKAISLYIKRLSRVYGRSSKIKGIWINPWLPNGIWRKPLLKIPRSSTRINGRPIFIIIWNWSYFDFKVILFNNSGETFIANSWFSFTVQGWSEKALKKLENSIRRFYISRARMTNNDSTESTMMTTQQKGKIFSAY